MELGIKNRFALVCASSKGLGFSVVESLLEEGCNVLMTSRNLDNLNNAEKIINQKKFSGVLNKFECDLSKPEEIINLYNHAISLTDRIDILVNNCGGPKPGNFELSVLLLLSSFFEDVSSDDFDYAITQNLKNTIDLTKLILPLMKKNFWGRIVNIASSSVKQPIDNLILSNITRSGLISFAKTISNQYASFNILINNVLPGRILTDRIKEIAKQKADKENIDIDIVIDQLSDDLPIKRLGEISEFGPLVAFLCSEKSSYITGNSIQVDGGLIKSLF